MATYPKTLKTLEIHMMLDSSPNTIADTADDPQASMALAQFVNCKDMVYAMEEGGVKGEITIPYHAVQYIKVTETVAQVEKAEAYDCEKSCCE